MQLCCPRNRCRGNARQQIAYFFIRGLREISIPLPHRPEWLRGSRANDFVDHGLKVRGCSGRSDGNGHHDLSCAFNAGATSYPTGTPPRGSASTTTSFLPENSLNFEARTRPASNRSPNCIGKLL